MSKSPLSGIVLPKNDTTEKKVVTSVKRKTVKKRNLAKIPSPRSYRFSYKELDLLKDKTEEVSQDIGSTIKITDTLILKSLIRLSDKISSDEILEEIKRIRIEI
jgi:hypothetical protein